MNAAAEWTAMSAAQRVAAVRNVDWSAPEPGDCDEHGMAVATHARMLVENDELESLVFDLHACAGALDRRLSGLDLAPGDTGKLLHLGRLLNDLYAAVERLQS